MKTLSFVIVTWNCKEYLRECLDSLEQYRKQPCAELIVVDNASTDGTPELVKHLYPDVILMESPVNLGFAKGNNIGIKRSTGQYLCLVNPDVKVLGGCV